LFLIHGVDGTVDRFQPLADRLDPEQPVYGLRAQALLGEKVALLRIEQLAAYYTQAIRTLGVSGPYHFLGFSFGGLVAFEMARQLHREGEMVGLLGMLDTLQMGSRHSSLQPAEAKATEAKRANPLTRHLTHLMRSGGLTYAKEKVQARILRGMYTFLDSAGRQVPGFLHCPSDINWFAAVNYTPQTYPGKVTLFEAAVSGDGHRSTKNLWGQLAGQGVDVIGISGQHENVLEEPHVSSLAAAITDCLTNRARSAP
jgi:aspartate racemase